MGENIKTYIGNIEKMSGSHFNIVSTQKSINDFPMSCMPTAFIVTTNYDTVKGDQEVDIAISDYNGNGNKILEKERNVINTLVKDLYKDDINNLNSNSEIHIKKPIHFAGVTAYEDIARCLRTQDEINGIHSDDKDEQAKKDEKSLKGYFDYIIGLINSTDGTNTDTNS